MAELKENIEFMKSAGLYGYYPPLLFNRIKPYPGTQFTKKYGYLSDEDYFRNDEVRNVFECMQQYKEEFHGRVNKIVDILEFMISANDGNTSEKINYAWLRMLPYNLFEKIVNNFSKCWDTYNSFVKNMRIEERLASLEKEYIGNFSESIVKTK